MVETRIDQVDHVADDLQQENDIQTMHSVRTQQRQGNDKGSQIDDTGHNVQRMSPDVNILSGTMIDLLAHRSFAYLNAAPVRWMHGRCTAKYHKPTDECQERFDEQGDDTEKIDR